MSEETNSLPDTSKANSEDIATDGATGDPVTQGYFPSEYFPKGYFPPGYFPSGYSPVAHFQQLLDAVPAEKQSEFINDVIAASAKHSAG